MLEERGGEPEEVMALMMEDETGRLFTLLRVSDANAEPTETFNHFQTKREKIYDFFN